MLFLKILLCILKIIGIVLLAIVGIVLLILCLLLFVPIRYRVHASFYGKPRVSAHVTYLLRLLHVNFELDGKESELKIKLFGHNISKDEETSDKTTESGQKTTVTENETNKGPTKRVKTEKTPENKTADIPMQDDNAVKEENDAVKSGGTVNDGEADRSCESGTVNETDRSTKPERPKEQKAPAGHKGQKEPESGITDKIKSIVSLIKENRGVIDFVMRQLKLLFKHIMPGSHTISIRLGLDDPALLGEIVGGISVFRAMTGIVINITPVWDDKVFEAELDFKGRIILGRVLYIAARVYFNKEVKKIIKTIKNSK